MPGVMAIQFFSTSQPCRRLSQSMAAAKKEGGTSG